MYARTITPAGSLRGDQLSARRHASASATQSEQIQQATSASWQNRAVAEYARSADERSAALRHELAARVAELTSQPIAPASIYSDDAASLAVVNVGGAVFRLQDRDLTLLRPCVHCGTGQHLSAPLRTLADLGYALGPWQPRCSHCEPVDPANWLDEV